MRSNGWLAQGAGRALISPKGVLVAYGLLLALACLWVPWKVDFKEGASVHWWGCPDLVYAGEYYAGYGFVWSRPAAWKIRRGVAFLANCDDAAISRLPLVLRIDSARLGLELLALTALAAVAILLVRGTASPPDPVSPTQPDSGLHATPKDIEEYRRIRDLRGSSSRPAERRPKVAESEHNDVNPSRERLEELAKEWKEWKARRKLQSQPSQPAQASSELNEPELQSLTGQSTPQTTFELHYSQSTGEWDADRVSAVHEPAIRWLFVGKNPSQQPTLYVLGGGMGVGKSTRARKLCVEHPNAVLIDYDLLKLSIPEFESFKAENLNTAAWKVHDESRHMAQEALRRAIVGRYDLILDTTSSQPVIRDFLMEAKARGYRLELDFVDVPVEVAIERIAKSARNPQSAYYGRWVPNEESGTYVDDIFASQEEFDRWLLQLQGSESPRK